MHDGLTVAQARAIFKEMREVAESAKRRKGDQWLLGVYRGIRAAVGTETSTTQEMRRKRRITDKTDLTDANGLQDEHNTATQQWASQMEQHIGSDVMIAASGSGFDSELVEKPLQSPQPKLATREAIRRNVVATSEQQKLIREQEELDDHIADEAAKVRRASGQALGRPKETRVQQLASASRVLRDKSSWCLAVAEKLAIEVDLVLEAAQAELKELPEDVSKMREELRKQLKESTGEIGKLAKASYIACASAVQV